MNKKNQSPKNQPQELSYYRLSLLAFLKESHSELANDTGFIAARGDSAVSQKVRRVQGYAIRILGSWHVQTR